MKTNKLKLLVLAAASLAVVACGPTTTTTDSTGTSTPPSSTQTSTSESTSESTSTSTTIPVVTHTVTVAAGEGYTATLDHADGVYEEGETVTVSITVTAVGMTVGEVKAGETAATVGVEEDGTYTATFALGTEDTEVTITLKAKEYSIGTPAILGDMASYYITGVTLSAADQTKVAYGTDVTVTVLFDQESGASASDIAGAIVYINGVGKALAPDETSVVGSGWSMGYTKATATFTMPAEDVEIAVFMGYAYLSEDQASGFTLKVEKNDYVTVYGAAEGVYYEQISLLYVAEAGYKVTGWEYSNDGGETWETFTGFYSGSNTGTMSTYSVGTGEILLKAVGEYVGSAPITYTNADKVVTTETGELPTAATIGETITIGYKGADGYSITDAATIEGVDPENIITNYENWGGEWQLSFVMPENEVTITFSVGENGTLSYEPNEHVTSVEFRDSSWSGNVITSAAAGAYVYAYVTVEEGYTLVSGSVNGGEAIKAGSDYEGNAYIAFAMPSDGSDAVLTLNVGQNHSISYNESEDYSLTFTVDYVTAEQAAAGQTVDFTLRPASVFITPTKLTLDGEDITFTKSSYGNSYTGSFTMPDHDAVLNVEVAKEDGHTLTLTLDDNKALIDDLEITGGSSLDLIGVASGTETLTGEFLVGETLSIDLTTIASDTLTPELYLVKGSEEEKLEPTDIRLYDTDPATIGYEYANVTLTEDITGFALRYATKAAASATLTAKDEGGADLTIDGLTYTLNGTTTYETIDALSAAIKVGDLLTINLPAAPADRAYNLTVKAGETELEPISGTTYLVTGPVDISIERIVSYALTINDGSNDRISVDISYDGKYYYGSFDGLELGKTMELTFSAYYLGGKTYTVTITNGDEEPITLQVLEAYEDYTATITVAGSVTIDIVAD